MYALCTDDGQMDGPDSLVSARKDGSGIMVNLYLELPTQGHIKS